MILIAGAWKHTEHISSLSQSFRICLLTPTVQSQGPPFPELRVAMGAGFFPLSGPYCVLLATPW
jgi:hypothetical protein